MNEYQSTFKRYEIKYLLDENKYFLLRQRLQGELKEDHYGKVTICNIYFDTPEHRLIRTSLDKPVYKEKLRLRSYGTPVGEDMVFAELKKKYKGVVYKRREKLQLSEAERYLYDKESPREQSQITKEIDWFMRGYPDLTPAMFISYERIAMYGIDNPGLRVTFDSNILWRENELYLGQGVSGKPLLKKGQQLMEIKIAGAIPLWFSHILDELKLYPSSYSKYGKGFLQSLHQNENMSIKGEKKYA